MQLIPDYPAGPHGPHEEFLVVPAYSFLVLRADFGTCTELAHPIRTVYMTHGENDGFSFKLLPRCSYIFPPSVLTSPVCIYVVLRVFGSSPIRRLAGSALPASGM